MIRKVKTRTQVCDRAHAETRLSQACKFYEVAELTASEENIAESSSVAAALAVLAGIAASDAACCAALGQRARGQDHHDAETLVRQIMPDGVAAATALRRLVDLKDTAHYGLFNVGGTRLKGALKQAKQLIEFAEDVLRR